MSERGARTASSSNQGRTTGQRPIGIGVIGCGYWGPNIIRNVANMDIARLAGVSDLSEERLAKLEHTYPGLRTTTDHRQLLNDPAVDAVIIATPIRTHHRLAMEALLQGKHVLIEKPLAPSTSECEELIETAEMVGRVLMVGHTFQYNPAVEKLRQLIRSGDLGRIYYIDCARLSLGLFQRDINVIWDLAPHDLSILIHILGTRPESVSARRAAHVVPGVADLAQIDLQFPGDIMAHVRVSWLDPVKVRRVTVVGSKKMAVYNDGAEDKIKIYDKRVALQATDGETDPVFQYHEGDIETPPIDWVEPLMAQISHFVGCIQTGQTPLSDGRMGLDVVRIMEAADRSRSLDSPDHPARTGRTAD